MDALNPYSLGLGWNAAGFAIASAVVWWAGDRLARYGDIIAQRTGQGAAVVGTVLIGLLVSLPELTLSAVAGAVGNANLAVNALLGGIAATMVMLAVTDATVKRLALSHYVEKPVVLLQGVLTLIMLITCAIGITAGDRLLPGIGLCGTWTTILALLFLGSVWLVRDFQRRRPWMPATTPADSDEVLAGTQASAFQAKEADEKRSRGALTLRTLAVAAAVVAAGAVLAFTADAITARTDAGAGLIGLLLGGVSTSLPELSTTISAARLNNFEMAYANVFGTNQCSLALLWVADLVFPGGPILNEVGAFSTFAVLLGGALTAITLAGLIARPRKVFFGMGIDSVAICIVAAAGLIMLSFLM